MDSAERREQREDLRERIIEAARDIVGEEGLDALSMRALAVRIGYSPATIYLHFQDKGEILRGVMQEGFSRLDATIARELGRLPGSSNALERYATTGRAYARFALENTGYFRAMFKLPPVAQMEMCPEPVRGAAAPDEARDRGVNLVRQAIEAGEMAAPDASQAATIGWAMIHGLTTLYLSGHLSDRVSSHDEFMGLIDSAIETLGNGWRPRAGE